MTCCTLQGDNIEFTDGSKNETLLYYHTLTIAYDGLINKHFVYRKYV